MLDRYFDMSQPWPYVLFYVVTVFWVLEFILFPSKFKSDDFKEKRTFRVILLGIVLTVLVNNVTVLFTPFYLDNTVGNALRIVAMVTYPLGLALRYISTWTLGDYFTRDVAVSEDQRLISHGPYRFLRHPLYVGLFLLTVSVPLFFKNIPVLFLSMLYMGYVLNQRMRVEEAAMERILGDRYRAWKTKRYRFIPFIY